MKLAFLSERLQSSVYECMHDPFFTSLCDCLCLRGHAVNKAPQLFDHSLYELLFISVILPEMRENVVLLTGVLHPTQREREGGGTERQVTQLYSLRGDLSYTFRVQPHQVLL